MTTKKSQKDIMLGWGHASDPVASICCITYNHEAYIREAIDSFLMQETAFPFEILIHDDASTDSTTEIILDYADRFPKIIKPIFQQENQYTRCGLINPRFVFPRARGKYIALCEGDDYWTDKTKLQKQVTFLENNPEYVITYTDCQPFNENGFLNTDFGGSTRDLESDELKQSTPIYTLTTCFRNVIGEFPQDLMSARLGDLVIWSLLGKHGRGKYLSDIKPSAYRIHDRGVHSKKSRRQQIEMLLVTYNALFAHYTRTGDEDNARYFHESSFKLSPEMIGWKRLSYLALKALAKKFRNQFLSILGTSRSGG